MPYVIATRGNESQKIVDGNRRKVVPFVGTDREGPFAQMGVGFIFVGETDMGMSIWGLLGPHKLIQSWRGMKVLERVEHIGHGTLCACWYAGGRKIAESETSYLNTLAAGLGGMETLHALREKVLASAPTSAELDSMISILRGHGIDIDDRELVEEVQAGRIGMLPVIEVIRQEAEVRRQSFRRELEEAKSRPPPVPRVRHGFLGKLTSWLH